MKRAIWVLINSSIAVGGFGAIILGMGLFSSSFEWVAYVLALSNITIGGVCIVQGAKGLKAELSGDSEEGTLRSIE